MAKRRVVQKTRRVQVLGKEALIYNPFIRVADGKDECQWDEPNPWSDPYEWEDFYEPRTGCSAGPNTHSIRSPIAEAEEWERADKYRYAERCLVKMLLKPGVIVAPVYRKALEKKVQEMRQYLESVGKRQTMAAQGTT